MTADPITGCTCYDETTRKCRIHTLKSIEKVTGIYEVYSRDIMPKMIGAQSYWERINEIERLEYQKLCREQDELVQEAEDFWYEETHNEPGYWDSLFKHPHE